MATNYGIDIPDYPKKLFYKINEVASITGVEAYVLRYWETKFPMLAPEKDDNDQRRYRQKDIDLIFYIKHLLYDEKYTIAGAVEVLKAEKGGKRKGRGRRSRKAAAEPAAVEADPRDEADSGPVSEEVRKRVASIRKDVRKILADVKAWRAERS